MLIGCKYGDDYQCHFIKGSELADRRLENVKETLDRLRLESERLQLTQLAINESDKLPTSLTILWNGSGKSVLIPTKECSVLRMTNE